jgi:hypothetical protein
MKKTYTVDFLHFFLVRQFALVRIVARPILSFAQYLRIARNLQMFL